MSKFKIGDKIKILPSATDMSIPEDEVGKTGVITYYHSSIDIMVLMDKIRKESGYRMRWCVKSSQIELVIKIRQQLLLWKDM